MSSWKYAKASWTRFPEVHFEYVGMYVPGLLFNSRTGNQVSEGYSHAKHNVLIIRSLCYRGLVSHIPYSAKSTRRQRPPIRIDIFVDCCSTLGWSNISTTRYYQITNCLTGRFNCAGVSRYRHYVPEDQTDWKSFLLRATYAYKVHVHRSIKGSLLGLAVVPTPPVHSTVVPECSFLASGDGHQIIADQQITADTVSYDCT